MNDLTKRSALAALLGLMALVSNSCETTGGSAAYYDSSHYNDPWYYGGYYDDPGYVVAPPGNRPDRPLSPSHPIARPSMGGGGFGGGGFGGGGRGGGGRR